MHDRAKPPDLVGSPRGDKSQENTMLPLRAPIDWVGTTKDMGYRHEEGATPEGTFSLDHPGEDGLVRVAFQLPMPEGISLEAHMETQRAARAAAEPGSRAYWQVARTYPSTGTEQGYFASHAMAHALIAAAGARGPEGDVAAILTAGGFRRVHGDTWERKAPCGRLCIALHDEIVHLRFERRGSRYWTNLLRLALSWRGHTGMVYAAWPAFMASVAALVRIAVDAADYANAQGLTGPKHARAKAA
jgi:hypothetical protein